MKNIFGRYNKSGRCHGGMHGKVPAIGLMFVAIIATCAGGWAQNSMPAPGSGGSFGGGGGGFGGGSLPAPGSGGSFNPAPAGPPPPPSWGGYGPYYNGPSWGITIGTPSWENSGTVTVMACGYDNYGTWRTIPLRVSYVYNGIDYDVTVMSAWNPWTDMWNTGIGASAYNTSYYMRGNTYDFYTVLPTGTYYFNL